MWEYNYSNEIYHHGIKGQRWGIRRFQKKDGSLTPAGLKRYSDSDEGRQLKENIKSAKKAHKQATKEYRKASLVPGGDVVGAMSKVEDRLVDVKRAKLDYKTGKEANRIREKNIEIKDKSKHRLKLEEQYKNLGMTDEQAQAAANNKIRTEKILAGVATLTVAAAAAYVFNEHRKTKIDQVIKAGQELQRIEMQNTNGKLHDVFYASTGDHDNKRYAALLGKERQTQIGESYMMKITAGKDVKVASQEKAIKAFADLCKNDKEFKKAVEETIKVSPDNMSQAKRMYNAFNTNLVYYNQNRKDIADKFYGELKKQGYGALQDINDMKNSGYGAKNPLIIFDNAAKSLKVTSSTKMSEVSSKEFLKELGKSTVETMIQKYTVPGAAAVVGATALNYRRNETKNYSYSRTNKFVKDYKKKHPNTNLSDGEIAKLYKQK